MIAKHETNALKSNLEGRASVRQMPFERGGMAASWVNYPGLQASVWRGGVWQESRKEVQSSLNYPHLNWLLCN